MKIKTRIRKIRNKIKNRKRFDLQQVPLAHYVVFSISMVIIYTISILFLSARGVDSSVLETLTTCFFSVFGGEILMCALIKIFKLKDVKDSLETEQTEDTPRG